MKKLTIIGITVVVLSLLVGSFFSGALSEDIVLASKASKAEKDVLVLVEDLDVLQDRIDELTKNFIRKSEEVSEAKCKAAVLNGKIALRNGFKPADETVNEIIMYQEFCDIPEALQPEGPSEDDLWTHEMFQEFDEAAERNDVY